MVAIQSETHTELMIAPNPATDFITFFNPNHEYCQIEVFDLNGKQCLNVVANQTTQIDISKLLVGVYILKINTESGIVMKRLIKE